MPMQSLMPRARRPRMSELLAQMPDPNNGSHMGGLASMLQKALLGYQMGKEQQGMQDTLAQASQALESRPGAVDAPGPNMSGDAGFNIAEKKPDMGKYAHILMENPDTMDMGFRAQASNAEAEARRRMMEDERAQRVQDMQTQRGWSQEDRLAQQAQQEKMFGMQSQQAREMAQINAGAAAGRQEPIAVMGEDGRPTLVSPRDAVGKQPYYQPKTGSAILGYTPSGEPIMGAAPKPLTNDQANAGLYSDRMAAADAIINRLGPVQSDPMQKAMGAIPFAGNYLVSPEYQQADQAQRDFINATLRRESGAAISDPEFVNARKQYFPQPGDHPETLAQKAQNRALAQAGIRQAAGANYKPITPGNLPPAGGQPASPPPQGGPNRPRAVNPKTGQMIEFDGQQWVTVNVR